MVIEHVGDYSKRMSKSQIIFMNAINLDFTDNLDYQRIASAIEYLSQHRRRQPSLQDLAEAMNLSPFHCQRLFQRWAGISPKKFLQYLTVEHAKNLLAQSHSVLDAALETGLSGPSRLHDHFVSLEAVTPGEFKSGGAGLALRYGLHTSPFGLMLLALSERGVCALRFIEPQALQQELGQLASDWPQAKLVSDQSGTAHIAANIFTRSQDRSDHTLPVLVRGTPFQISVWKALLRIPEGEARSYSTIAQAVDRPRAVRAVGSAIGSNPVAYLIPCHRVLRRAGELGGYRWGLPRKQALLVWESARRDHQHSATASQILQTKS